jgi:ABC-2 type transport system permease protein
MQQVLHIFRKEFKDYFISPIAYIVIAIFLLITGWFFFMTFFIYDQAELRGFFQLLPLIFSFVIPAVTMRLFSEEMNVGSYETLLTLPVSAVEIILGKFLAAAVFIAAMLLPTLLYPVTISFMGDLDWGPVLGGYIGALCLGGGFCAVGIFASCLTRNQIVAFIIGMIICFCLTTIDQMLFFFPRKIVAVVSYLGAGTHFDNIAKGIVDSRDLLYFLSLVFIALFATNLVMEEKK